MRPVGSSLPCQTSHPLRPATTLAIPLALVAVSLLLCAQQCTQAAPAHVNSGAPEQPHVLLRRQQQRNKQPGRTLGSFLWFSDFHLEPFYASPLAYHNHGDCTRKDSNPYGIYGCDSPWALIKSAVDYAKALHSSPDFIVSTGDYARHGNDEVPNPLHQLKGMIMNITNLLVDAFPNASAVHSPSAEPHAELLSNIGNNDVVPDYHLVESSKNNSMLNLVTEAFRPALASQQEVEDMQRGGYLIRNVTSTLSIISINTVAYSIYHTPKEPVATDPFGQFAWLRKCLTRLKKEGRKALIIGHIPPTVGSYDKTQYWRDKYIHQYYDILHLFEDTVPATLFAHLHSDEFRLGSERSVPPLFIGSSITPIYNNNPNFRRVVFDMETGDLIDSTTYYLDIATPLPTPSPPPWKKLYSFTEAYNVTDMTKTSLQKILHRIEANVTTPTFSSFMSNLRANVEQQPCDESCWREWVCVLQALTERGYQRCTNQAEVSHVTILAASIAGAALLFIVIVSIIAIRRKASSKRRRRYIELLYEEEHNDDSE